MEVKVKNRQTGYEATFKEIRSIQTVNEGEWFTMIYEDGASTTLFESSEWDYEVMKGGYR